jgi:two-component system cell cycle sensor histidine kinase PleC
MRLITLYKQYVKLMRRYIGLLLFLLLTASVALFTAYFRYTAQNEIIHYYWHKNQGLIGTYYKQQIWDRYAPVVRLISENDSPTITRLPQHLSFNSETKKFADTLLALQVVIYSPKDTVISSPDMLVQDDTYSLFNFFQNDAEARNQAKNGAASYAIIRGKFGNSQDEVWALRYYTPLILMEPSDEAEPAKNQPQQYFVMAIDRDITEVINSLSLIQLVVTMLMILPLGAVIIAISLANNRANAIIEKQQEASIEMAEAKANAEAESQEKSKFLANVSHELRTPLNAIIGFSEIIKSESMGPIGNEQYKEFVRDIHTSGVHLLSLINDILDYSKIEEQKLEVHNEEIDIIKTIRTCTRMVKPRADEAQVTLVEEIPKEHLVIIADSKRVKQVILNILSNAVKFTPENGKVVVKLWKDIATNSVIIEIADSGVGMAPQDIAKALAPFGQVDNKLSRRYEGTGLGLSITKKLVELMGGKFNIKSEVGLGTTVTIVMPIQTNNIEEDA